MDNERITKSYPNMPYKSYETILDALAYRGLCKSTDTGYPDKKYWRSRIDRCRVELAFQRSEGGLGVILLRVEDGPKIKPVFNELDAIILNQNQRKK